jgi:PhoH-like ATPase
MKKTYVLDTNVFLSDPNSIFSFDDNDVIIPMVVLEELDRFKTRQDEVGRNAREVSRKFDDLRLKGSLLKGVSLPSGGTCRVSHVDDTVLNLLPPEMKQEKSADNLIIAQMLSTKTSVPDAILVSKDINVRIKCDALGIACQDYLNIKKSLGADELFTGVAVVHIEEDLINKFYENKYLEISEFQKEQTFYQNQILVLKGPTETTQKSALTKLHGDSLVPIEKYEEIFGLRPRNKEQQFSFDLLMDDDIKLVTLTAPAGCGKTLLALAAGLEQLQDVGSHPKYNKLIISRPVQPMGRDIGFLPGTFEEKMAPWLSPIKDNLEFLFGVKPSKIKKKSTSSDGGIMNEPYMSILQEKGLIEVEAITYIRGRSIPNAFIIIDEAQNLSVHELKTIITRVGEGTKIVLTGDIEQIDNPYVDSYTNGLTYAIEKFKEYPIAGHIKLLKGERSALATLASKIL